MASAHLLILGLVSAFVTSGIAADEEKPLSVRIVTWNVLSSDWMSNKLDPRAVNAILGPLGENRTLTAASHDIVVVALQENCYKCDKGKERELAQPFLSVLQKSGDFEFVSYAKTRDSSYCQLWSCNTHQFGTAIIMIFARKGLLQAGPSTHVNGCDGVLIHNAEKGVAGVRTVVKATGKSICFAGLHLDSKKQKNRQECLSDFWAKARREASWHSCDVAFITGDYNTRPGPNKDFFQGSVSRDAFGDEFFKDSWVKDEMTGLEPWGGVRLIDHIIKVSGYVFEEAPVNFLPTYSIQPLGTCGGDPPCFKGIRQPAWTDRILCHNCKPKFYSSMLLGKSDHDPVIGVYDV